MKTNRYKYTKQLYEDLYLLQEGKCYKCGLQGKLLVDKNSTTKEIEGLVCRRCYLIKKYEYNLERLKED